MRTLALITLSFVAFSSMGQLDESPNKKAIICLTYDDEVDSHVTTVLPQLDSLGFKATFFLNSIRGSGTPELTLLAWKTAAKNGHELGNHTLFHPCPEKYGWQKDVSIESYSLIRLMREIELTNSYLTAIDGMVKERVFAYPCNNTFVEGMDYSRKLKESKLVKYARAGADRTSIVRDYKSVDLMKVPSWLVEEGTSLKELIAFANEVKKNGKMGIYQFHGVGCSPFEISPKVHKQFLEYLKANQADYLVTTFSGAMDYITGKEAK